MLIFALIIGGGVGTTHAADSCHSERFSLLSQICNSEDEDEFGCMVGKDNKAVDCLKHLIGNGQLSKAREIAYDCLFLARGSKSSLSHCCPASSEHVTQAYKDSVDSLFRENRDFLGLIAQVQQQENDEDDINCSVASPKTWDGHDSSKSSMEGSNLFGELVSENDVHSNMSHGSTTIERWNDCCSFFRSDDKECFDVTCELAEGLDNHLILPALREPSVSIRLKFRDSISKGTEKGELIKIEQEGSLRMFDVSGVLWPAGFLLGLCLADPLACGFPEVLDAVHNWWPFAVELGAGVGFPSISFAKTMEYHKKGSNCDANVCDQRHKAPMIVATDISNASLALITSNAYNNGVGNLVAAKDANHTDSNSLSILSQQVFTSYVGDKRKDGFDVIFGSSLQALFDGTERQGAALWQSLDSLLSKRKNAVVLLSHVRTGDEKIEVPQESGRLFELVRRVSGDHFGMKTRDGHRSDFELVMLRRRRQL
ncbi:hypothetical protein ACHAXR_011147 [Thalassiosira sp. AJA248-18]